MKTARALSAFGGLICIAAAAAVIGGLYVSGSPTAERLRRLDQQRRNDLQQIAYGIDSHYATHGTLPADLSAAAAGPYAIMPTDPDTQAPYEYEPLSGGAYRLCATFSLPSSEAEEGRYGDRAHPMIGPSAGFYGHSFDHPAGRHCFEFNAENSRRIPCGPDWSCPGGTSCVSLPNYGQACVPKGKECAAAGCPDSCLIAESFPPQIRCAAAEQAPAPAPVPPKGSCSMYKEKKSGKVGCYGCASGVCSTAPAGWESYAPPAGSVGIPYACFESEHGCELAQ